MSDQQQKPFIPAMQATQSSNIQGIAFHEGALYLQFGRKIYKYTGDKVAQHHADLLKAESMGKHFQAAVRRCPDTKCELVHTIEEQG